MTSLGCQVNDELTTNRKQWIIFLRSACLAIFKSHCVSLISLGSCAAVNIRGFHVHHAVAWHEYSALIPI